MSERWVSQGRKFCRFCNCWYADNKASIESHERGASHRANVDKELDRTRKYKLDQEAAQKILMEEMQKIEAAALKSLEDDAKRDPFARNEWERVQQAKSKSMGETSHR